MFRANSRKIFSSLFALVAFFTLLPVDQAKAQSAPPLTEFRVIGVASPGYLQGSQWDTVQAGAFSTPNDHRGGGLYVAVFERGYGQGQTASFNGVRMNLVSSEQQVGANRVIYGWIRIYHSPANFTSGTFTSSARSMNSPWNTMSTRLTIR
jgi:hypothetical protein